MSASVSHLCSVCCPSAPVQRCVPRPFPSIRLEPSACQEADPRSACPRAFVPPSPRPHTSGILTRAVAVVRDHAAADRRVRCRGRQRWPGGPTGVCGFGAAGTLIIWPQHPQGRVGSPREMRTIPSPCDKSIWPRGSANANLARAGSRRNYFDASPVQSHL